MFEQFGGLGRAFSNHLLHAVPARSALFKKWNAFFSTKNSRNTCRLGGCSVLNVLNLEKCGVKDHNCAHLLHFIAFFGFTARMPLFRISFAGAKFQALFNLASCSSYSITNYDKILVFHYFEKVNKGHLKVLSVNYKNRPDFAIFSF